MSTKIQWKIDADFMQACNCDYGCPCEFSAPPTKGYCEGVGAWRITKGSYGDLKLDGLCAGFIARWPKAIHEGNGTLCALIDEKASKAQRDALLQIMSGQAGGMPFEILATTFSKLLDPLFLPFQFNLNGKNSSVKAGDALTISCGPIRNPVTNDTEEVKVHHATGFIFKEADCVSADEMHASAGELRFSWPKKAGFVARINYSN